MILVQVNGIGPWSLPETLLERGARAILEEEGLEEGELSLTFLDDAGIQSLNSEYLGKGSPTDVIAFALQSGAEPLLGDVYIGYEQARRQAEENSIALEEELLRLAIHGTLHVVGYSHPEGEDRAGSEMYRRQEEVLHRILTSR